MIIDGKKVKIGALILAGGSGTRFGSGLPKQFLPVAETPMFLFSVDAFLPLVDRVVLVMKESEIGRAEAILDTEGLSEDVRVVPGGEDRARSSIRGLRALTEEGGVEYVLIHDAARCLVTEEIVRRVAMGAVRYGAAIAAVPSHDTVKIAAASGTASPAEANPETLPALPEVEMTTDRSRTYQVQTPQGFQFGLITSAYLRAEAENALSTLTDDASAVERFTDHKVYLVPGDEQNLKVTTPLDLAVAEIVVTMRKGEGS